MVLKRIMPCLLLKEGRLVKTVNFKNPNYIGDPINAVKIYNEKEVDELVLLDIHASKHNTPINFELLTDFAAECFMPLSYGGGVKTLNDFKKLYRLGIEKVIVNTLLIDHPQIIIEAVKKYGSQSIVASIDVKTISENYTIYSHAGRKVDLSFNEYLNHVIALGVGEILLTSVDQEGTWNGFDNVLIEEVNRIVNVPIIANGGCGNINGLKDILNKSNIQAAALGSMAVYQKKDMGVLIRFPKREQIINDEQPF